MKTAAQATVDHPEDPKPATLILTRRVKMGHGPAFEDLLRRFVAESRQFDPDGNATVLCPRADGPPVYTLIRHFESERDMRAWRDSQVRARLLAETDEHGVEEAEFQQACGSEGWLEQPASTMVEKPSKWRTMLVGAVALIPVVEGVNYLLVPLVSPDLPRWARPLATLPVTIPLMQYVVMPTATRVFRRFLYPHRRDTTTARAA